MFRPTGLLKDDGKIKRMRFSTQLRPQLGAKPKGSGDLGSFRPVYTIGGKQTRVLDQNFAGSCVPSAVGPAVYTALAVAGDPLPFVPGVLEPYKVMRAGDRADDNPFTDVMDLPALRDVGTRILSAVEAIGKWGIGPMGPWVKIGGVQYASDCGPANVNGEPDFEALQKAGQTLIVGPYQLTSGKLSVVEAQLSIDAGYPVVLGGWVDTITFDPYRKGSPPIGAQDKDDTRGGGHAIWVFGYYTLPSGRVVFRVLNSWSEEWGDLGEAEVTEDFIEDRWESYAFKVQKALRKAA